MVDYELRDFQLPHRLGKGAKALHVSDVHNYQKVDTAEGSGPLIRFIRHIRSQKESEGLGPRRGIDDSGFHSAAIEQPRKRCLGAAAVTVSVDVSAECDRAPRAELPREALYRFNSVWRYRKKINHSIRWRPRASAPSHRGSRSGNRSGATRADGSRYHPGD